MCPSSFVVPLVLLLFSHQIVVADPISIRSGLVNKNNQADKQTSNAFDLTNIKGISNFEAEAGFNRNNQQNHAQAQDAGKFDEAKQEKKVHSNEDQFNDQKFHQQNGGQVSDTGKKSQKKKGHHKNGFTKSYHKDETSDNTSYYDDSDDEDGRFEHDSRKSEYGDSGGQSQRGQHLDDKRYEEGHNKKGSYDTAGNYEKALANQNDYNSKNYHDRRENENRQDVANVAGHGGSRFAEEDNYVNKKLFYPHEYYHDDYYNRPQQRITIYEDPRYVDRGYERFPRESDYDRLEFRRPPPIRDYDRYYDRRRPVYYDDYY